MRTGFPFLPELDCPTYSQYQTVSTRLPYHAQITVAMLTLGEATAFLFLSTRCVSLPELDSPTCSQCQSVNTLMS